MEILIYPYFNLFLLTYQVLKGSHYFNIGDHGGIMVAVKYFKTEGRTNELMYSINEGVDWKTVKFYKEPLKARGQTTL